MRLIAFPPLLLLLCLLAACEKKPAGVTEITLYDKNRQTIRRIDDPESLRAFNELWQARKIGKDPDNPNYQYYISVVDDSGAARYLYDTRGYAHRSNKPQEEAYRFQDHTALNKILFPRE